MASTTAIRDMEPPSKPSRMPASLLVRQGDFSRSSRPLGGRSVLCGSVMPLAREVADSLRISKQIYVATRRADGAPSKVVPGWFILDGEAVCFTTRPERHK